MNAQTAIQNILRERITEARLKNPAISLRAFSKRLRMNPATLSRVLNGRRRVSPKLAKRLLDEMGTSPAETLAILSQFPRKRPYQRGSDSSGDTQESLVLTMDQYHVVSDWYHFALRALLRTKEAQRSRKNSDPKWLAERLGIKAQEARQAVERLLRLEMIARLPDGRLRATDASFHSPDGLPSASIRNNHLQHLDLARTSLTGDPIEARDFTNLVLTIDPKQLPKARAAIRRFRKELDLLLESDQTVSGGSRQEVYSLAIQLFPLTRLADKQ